MNKINLDDLNDDIEEVINFAEIENSCNINLDEELKPPEILLSIGEHDYKNRMYPTAVCTSGESSSIIAKSKAKKSFLKSAFLACYIGGQAQNLFPNIKSHRNELLTVLDFDTEQGNYYTQRSFRRVIEMVGRPYEHYFGYGTRHLSSRQRLLLIDYCLKNQDKLYKKPVKLVAIDGIADLVENTNDLVMSKEAADYIMRWTYEYKIHIIKVIHKNPTTGKPLGHLGTFVLKKDESVIELDIEENNTVKVSNPYSRGYRFDEFFFDVNNDALPYLVNGY